MKRIATAVLGLALAFPAIGAEPGIEGLYQKLPTPQPTSDPDRIEVVEVFWYGCPHCNRFQPFLEPWIESLPDHVRFVRMPAVFSDVWELHARAYYIAAALGVLDEIHPRIFAAIHDEGRRLETLDAIRDFFVAHGVDASDFDKQANSFSVKSGVQRSLVMQRGYGLRGVPALIVNGRFLVSGSTAGSYPKVLEVTDALVAREHEAAGG
ncbi:MAG: thiol:disulfide interchange protein DsbA/DsbL [Immundisolibacterales bacterium]|nr:thiol:disulfide interchange protein DsbA/DsbL [Immundisolibacterales bacterium]